MKRLSFATAIAGLLMTGAAFAADSYDIDPTHAWVRFETNHAGWSQAQGAFKAVSGTIAFDKEDVTKSTVEIVLEAASIDTNDEKRDTHLKSPDFLNAEEFPQITFKSTAIEKTGDKTAKVTGDLTLLGTAKPVVLDVTWNAESPASVGREHDQDRLLRNGHLQRSRVRHRQDDRLRPRSRYHARHRRRSRQEVSVECRSTAGLKSWPCQAPRRAAKFRTATWKYRSSVDNAEPERRN